jgi:hypothetical protein
MRRFLLPYKFKYWGIFMFPLGFMAWTAGQLEYFHPFLKSVNFLFPGFQIILLISFFSFLLGLYFLVFSKEKKEDEFILKVRLESSQFAALLQLSFFICSFIYMAISRKEPGGRELEGWMLFLLLSIFIFWLSYVIRFNFILFRNRLRIRNEK